MNAGRTEDEFSAKEIQEGTTAPSPICGASGTYTRNLASSNVPHLLSLSGGEETLLWPIKVVAIK